MLARRLQLAIRTCSKFVALVHLMMLMNYRTLVTTAGWALWNERTGAEHKRRQLASTKRPATHARARTHMPNWVRYGFRKKLRHRASAALQAVYRICISRAS